MPDNWFTLDKIDRSTYVISEYKHWEQTHCYLLVGDECCLLIDTGLGVGDIGLIVNEITSKPVIAVPTHIHWDHIGGLKYFNNFYVHSAESCWITGLFPLPLKTVREMVCRSAELPENFDIENYQIFQGKPTKLLYGGEKIDIGGRIVEVIHTPGHSPGHMCFWEEERGLLFSGDLAYEGTLYANYPSTQPDKYLQSIEKVAMLSVKRLLPAHFSLQIRPQIMIQIRNELRKLNAAKKLCHGAGTFNFNEWSIKL